MRILAFCAAMLPLVALAHDRQPRLVSDAKTWKAKGYELTQVTSRLLAPVKYKRAVEPVLADVGLASWSRTIKAPGGHEYHVQRVLKGERKGTGVDSHVWTEGGLQVHLIKDLSAGKPPTLRIHISSLTWRGGSPTSEAQVMVSEKGTAVNYAEGPAGQSYVPRALELARTTRGVVPAALKKLVLDPELRD